jgi:hypothetical protein
MEEYDLERHADGINSGCKERDLKKENGWLVGH